ncbi:MAG: tetratricopeptide repeat protein, partial [Victivallales bacterium]|nr:tetratricopeptide repeat protein [Victivallales bacterium]
MRYLIFIALLPLVLLAETPKSILRKGNRAFKEGKRAEAIKDYDSALQQLPDNPYLTYNKGVAYLADANYEQAARQFLEAQKQSLAAKKHDVDFEARCLASAGDAQYSQAKAMSESKEQNQQQLEAALKLCQDAMANYQNSQKVKPGNKNVQEAAKQANLLNKKLLGMKYLLPPPPQQQQQ